MTSIRQRDITYTFPWLLPFVALAIAIEGLVKRYQATNVRLAEIDAARLERGAKRTNIPRFLKNTDTAGHEIVTEFDEELWFITVYCITVHADGRLAVTFRDGFNVDVMAKTWK